MTSVGQTEHPTRHPSDGVLTRPPSGLAGKRRTPGRPLGAMAVAVVGAGVGVVVVLWGARSTPQSRAFIEAPEALVWVLAVATLTAYQALIAGPLWLTWWRLRGYVEGRVAWWGIVLASGVFLALVLAPVLARLVSPSNEWPIPLSHAQLKTGILTLLGGLVALPGVMTIWLIDAASEDGAAGAAERLRELVWLRRQLLGVAGRLAGMVALVTLSSGAFRNALEGGPAAFPNYLVFVYGAYFTALFAILYVPVYSDLKSAGEVLIDRLYPTILPDSPDFQRRQEQRAAMEAMLELRVGAADSLKIVGIVLTPLITSLATVLVGISIQ